MHQSIDKFIAARELRGNLAAVGYFLHNRPAKENSSAQTKEL